ncbi:MAG: hypothetical protein KatS3mg002_0980 [Candidatus Woesearchaeota archaeon]|nr:MAG: hypothetical protein KatS3mg002_0980 [Candidatus Woesearchaeota archaeon]
MPEYVFKCKDCNQKFSIFLKMAETIDYIRCPHCKSTNVVKKYFPTPIHFKGGGFTKSTEEKGN